MGTGVVELRAVTATYEGEHIPALHGIDLAVNAGHLVAIVGPNGSGKTTLLEVVNGLLPITAGTVRVLGEPVSPGSHRLRRRIAYLPQDLFFEPQTPFLTRDVVLMGRYATVGALRLPGPEDRRLAAEAMTAMGVAGFAARPIGRLSGGQQRKVLLARVLARRPEVLLLDEPMTNLDPQSKEELAELILRVQEDLSPTTLLVSHEATALLEAADRVLTLVAGRILPEGEGWDALSGAGAARGRSS